MTREIASRPPDPLKPAAEWLRGVRRGWIPSSNVSLAVAGRVLFDYEPEQGAAYFVGATVAGFRIASGLLGLILFNPMADLLSDRALRSLLAHELLHVAGILQEEEADRLVGEAARLRPELLASPGELDAEVEERVRPLLEGVDIWSEFVLPPPTTVYVIGEPRLHVERLYMVSVSLPIISCAGV
ncbi:MAG: hypothetical protein QXT28_06205 [Thermofilaceae archaeon]